MAAKHALSWFEIPSADFDRARSFYGSIFESDLPIQEMPDGEEGVIKMAFLPCDEGGVEVPLFTMP